MLFLLTPNGFFYNLGSNFNSKVIFSGNAVDTPMDLLKGFFSDYIFNTEQQEETIGIFSEDYIHGNENVLCLYNTNSTLSRDICFYYLEKRPGASILGLDIPDNSFWYPVNKQDMSRANFEKYVNLPLKNWIANHPEKFITHLAVAKDIPYKVDYRSAAGYLATDGQTIDSVKRNTYFYTDGFNLKHFNPREHTNVKFAVSFLQGYNLEDIKMIIDKAQMPASAIENQKWVVDADTDHITLSLNGSFNTICGDIYLINGTRYQVAPVNTNHDVIACGTAILPLVGWGIFEPFFIVNSSSPLTFIDLTSKYNSFPSLGVIIRENIDVNKKDFIINILPDTKRESYFTNSVYTDGINDFTLLKDINLSKINITLLVDGSMFLRLALRSSNLNSPKSNSGLLIKKSGFGPEVINYTNYFEVSNYINYSSYSKIGFSIGRAYGFYSTTSFDEPGFFRKSVLNSGINSSNIFLDETNFKYNLPGDVIYYYGSGSYHKGYPWLTASGCNYGYGCWITTPNLFNFNVSNRAIFTSSESWNAENFFGNSNHTGMTGASPGQGKIIDSFSPNTFGGVNYSRSFSGALGYVNEPYGNPLSMNWAYLYSSGLTLGEVYLASNPYLYDSNPVESRGAPLAGLTAVIAVGDPLMRLNENPIIKKGMGANCSIDEECLGGKCVGDINGDKFCFNSNGEGCLLSVCGNSKNAYNCLDFNIAASSYSGLIERLVILDKGISRCANYSNIAFCDGTNWIYSPCVSGSCEVSREYWNNNSCSSQSLPGGVCNTNEDCLSSFMGFRGYCSSDLEGVKRCHFDRAACVIDSTGNAIPSNHSYCLDSNRKILCKNATWSEVSFCENGCLEGFCIFNNSEEFTFDKLLPGEFAYYAIPLIPEKNTLNSLFGDYLVYNDHIDFYPVNAPVQMVVKVRGFQTIALDSIESWWKNKILAGNGGLAQIPSGASVSEKFIGVGDAFIITKINVSSNLTIKGIKPDYKQVIQIKNNTGQMISIWGCPEEYNAERFLGEINLLGANCSRLSSMNKNGSFDNLFDSQFLTSYNFKKGYAYYLICGNMQPINWTPSCSSDVFCKNNTGCGVNGYVGNNYCSGNNLVRDYVNFNCNNPGTISSSCLNITTVVLNKTCDYGCNSSMGECNSFVRCSSDLDCGQNYFVEEPFCLENDIYKERISFSCINSGLSSSYCSNVSSYHLQRQCESDFFGNWDENYCLDNSVVREREVELHQCSFGECLEESFIEREIVANCEYGCSSGNCIFPFECFTDEDCVGDNPCVVGVCNNSASLNSACFYSNLPVETSCGLDRKCFSGECRKVGKILNQSMNNTFIFIESEIYTNQTLLNFKKVGFKLGNNKVLEFLHNFSNRDLDLTRFRIIKNISKTNNTYIIIQNLNSSLKTVYLEKNRNSSNAVCIADRENINNETDIISNCTILPCPGSFGGYNCSNQENYLVISGLKHSGVIEYLLYCGDGVCNNGESCSSCSVDCGNCQTNIPPEDSGSSGGDSSSGSSKKTCLTDWNCTEWQNCINNKQIRTCVKINKNCDVLSPAIIEKICVENKGELITLKEPEQDKKNSFEFIFKILIIILGIFFLFFIAWFIHYLARRF